MREAEPPWHCPVAICAIGGGSGTFWRIGKPWETVGRQSYGATARQRPRYASRVAILANRRKRWDSKVMGTKSAQGADMSARPPDTLHPKYKAKKGSKK